MNPLEIIDPHVHYWDPYTTPRTATPLVKLLGRFPCLLDKTLRFLTPIATVNFFGETESFTNPYLPTLYFSETGPHTIKGVVHIQADWQAKQHTDFALETAWLDQLEQPPLAIVGEARLHDVTNLDAVLDAHLAASSRFRGIRDMLAHHPSKAIHNFNAREDMMQTAAFRQGFAKLGERGLTFDAFIYANQLSDLCDLVEAVPETKIVVDHMATPIGTMGPFGGIGSTVDEREKIRSDWQEGLKRLAQSEQVHMKLSGLFLPVLGWTHGKRQAGVGPELAVDQVVEMIGADIQFALETFGPERLMFASNFPPDRVLMDFETLYSAYFQITEGLGENALTSLFSGTAKNFYIIA